MVPTRNIPSHPGQLLPLHTKQRPDPSWSRAFFAMLVLLVHEVPICTRSFPSRGLQHETTLSHTPIVPHQEHP